MEISQRLLRVQMMAKSMTGEEIARELIHVLSINYSVNPNSLLAAMRDRASVNNVAMRTLKVVYPTLVDAGCFSHAINLAGESFKTPTLSEFLHLWVSLFAHSPKARLLWKEQVGFAVRSYSATRLWSQWHQLMTSFGDVESFLTSHNDMAPATTTKLLSVLANKKDTLKVELAAVIDAGEPLVKTTYYLEGDGPLSLNCYEAMTTVLTSIRTGHYPIVEAVSRSLSGGDTQLYEKWVQYAMDCIEPGLEYFGDAICGSLSNSMEIFKAARVFNPQKAVEMQPSATALDCLAVIPFLDALMLQNLKAELPIYLTKAADISPDCDPLQWWRMNSTALPYWSAALRKILLVQPSSAAAERVFSLLNSSFNDRQYESLQDYIELSLMYQYNKR